MDGERAQGFSLLGPAWIDLEPPEGIMEAIYLSPEDAREMMELLSGNGVFGSQRLPGVWGAELERGRSMSVLVGQHIKTFVFGPGAASPWFERTFASVSSTHLTLPTPPYLSSSEGRVALKLKTNKYKQIYRVYRQ